MRTIAMHFTDACEPHEERALLRALSRIEEFADRGLMVRLGEPCGVVVSRGSHVRGVWHAGGGIFDFVPAGYNEPQIVVETLEEVIELTRTVLLPAGMRPQGMRPAPGLLVAEDADHAASMTCPHCRAARADVRAAHSAD